MFRFSRKATVAPARLVALMRGHLKDRHRQEVNSPLPSSRRHPCCTTSFTHFCTDGTLARPCQEATQKLSIGSLLLQLHFAQMLPRHGAIPAIRINARVPCSIGKVRHPSRPVSPTRARRLLGPLQECAPHTTTFGRNGLGPHSDHEHRQRLHPSSGQPAATAIMALPRFRCDHNEALSDHQFRRKPALLHHNPLNSSSLENGGLSARPSLFPLQGRV